MVKCNFIEDEIKGKKNQKTEVEIFFSGTGV
jgi:hypothetical protein